MGQIRREPIAILQRRTTVRRTSLWLVAVVAFVLGLAPGAQAAPAQDDGDDSVSLALTVGADGHISPSRAYPVLVDITTSRLLTGTLVVTVETDFGPSRIQVPVEVAATTTKRFVVTAPPGSSFGGAVTARLTSGGRSLAEETSNLSIDQSDELVGVLPGLASALDRATVPLAIDVGVARLSELLPEVLAEGPLALEVYDQIASGPGDLDDLSSADRTAIARWVAQGGHLLVDATAGLPVSLPEELDPSPGSYRSVGLGRVALTGGVLAAGRWEEALFPTPTQSTNEEGMLGSGIGMIGDVTSSLARDAGFRLPGILTLVLVLAAYIVVVGPIAWLIGRRTGRATRVWVIVPVVAALVTGALQLAGDEFKGSDDAVHVTMIEVGPTGGLATTSVFVASRGRGGTSIDLPPGWQVATNPFFGSFDGRVVPLVRSGDRASVPVDPGSGGASVVRVRGPVDVPGGLVVTATSDEDGVVRGTVENRLGVDLADVAVFVSRAAHVEVGALGAGDTRTWEIDDATEFDFNAAPEASVWPVDVDPRMFGGGPVAFGPNGEPIEAVRRDGGDDPVSSLSAFGDLTSTRGTNFKPPGQAIAVGWTRHLDAPIRVGGDAVDDGRTGVVGRTAVSAAGDRMTDTVAARFLFRGSDAAAFGGGRGVAILPAPGEPGQGVPENSGSGLFGFLLPGAVGDRPVDEARLRLNVPGLFAGAQVWTTGGWVDLPVTVGGGPQEVDLPDGAVVNGAVYARMLIPFDQIPGPGREFVLYEAAG